VLLTRSCRRPGPATTMVRPAVLAHVGGARPSHGRCGGSGRTTESDLGHRHRRDNDDVAPPRSSTPWPTRAKWKSWPWAWCPPSVQPGVPRRDQHLLRPGRHSIARTRVRRWPAQLAVCQGRSRALPERQWSLDKSPTCWVFTAGPLRPAGRHGHDDRRRQMNNLVDLLATGPDEHSNCRAANSCGARSDAVCHGAVFQRAERVPAAYNFTTAPKAPWSSSRLAHEDQVRRGQSGAPAFHRRPPARDWRRESRARRLRGLCGHGEKEFGQDDGKRHCADPSTCFTRSADPVLRRGWPGRATSRRWLYALECGRDRQHFYNTQKCRSGNWRSHGAVAREAAPTRQDRPGGAGILDAPNLAGSRRRQERAVCTLIRVSDPGTADHPAIPASGSTTACNSTSRAGTRWA